MQSVQHRRTVELLGRPYTLHVTTNAMAQAEIASGLAYHEIVAWFAKQSAAGARAFGYMCLVEHQPELTINAVGTLIDDVGGAQRFTEILSGHLDPILDATTVDPEDAKELGLGARPPQAHANPPDGTGTASSSPLGASA